MFLQLNALLLVGRSIYTTHIYVTYSSHLYHGTVAEVLGSGVVETLPIFVCEQCSSRPI